VPLKAFPETVSIASPVGFREGECLKNGKVAAAAVAALAIRGGDRAIRENRPVFLHYVINQIRIVVEIKVGMFSQKIDPSVKIPLRPRQNAHLS
jgi:hypothetical protein